MIGESVGVAIWRRDAHPVAATVHEVKWCGLSKVEPKQQIILTSTRSRHPSFDGDCALSQGTLVASRQRLRWAHHLAFMDPVAAGPLPKALHGLLC